MTRRDPTPTQRNLAGSTPGRSPRVSESGPALLSILLILAIIVINCAIAQCVHVVLR